MDQKNRPINPHQKALGINLDSRIYGTFAETGAGQEVARWFFRVGGAAGTVAKTMSAYDMQVSDAIYGKSDRYVSKKRLTQMLQHEFKLNIERLSPSPKRLFAFANTVATRGFRGRDLCHGWMGVRFQHTPGAEPSQVIIHFEMLENDNAAQQETVGILGVNLLYSSFYYLDDLTTYIQSLHDSLGPQKLRIDMLESSGPGFGGIDNRLMALLLVKHGLGEVAMFSSDNTILQPSEFLHKKPILIERGSFRPITRTNIDIIEGAKQVFLQQPDDKIGETIVCLEMTMNNLLERGELNVNDFLAQADLLATTGLPVMITDFPETYRLVGYLLKHTHRPIGLALGAALLIELFEERYYTTLAGGLLEAAGRIFKGIVTLYVYPSRQSDGSLLTADTISFPPPLNHLFEYLKESGFIRPITTFNPELLDITSHMVRTMIEEGDENWKNMVPEKVRELIIQKGVFGVAGGSTP